MFAYLVESTSKTKISRMLFISWQQIREYGNAIAGRQSNASTLKQVTVYPYVPKNRTQITVGAYKLCNYKITVLKLLETYFFLLYTRFVVSIVVHLTLALKKFRMVMEKPPQTIKIRAKSCYIDSGIWFKTIPNENTANKVLILSLIMKPAISNQTTTKSVW